MSCRSILMVSLIVSMVVTSFSSAPAADPASQSSDSPRFAILETDEGLPGSGPIRRYDWFKQLCQRRRSQWASAQAGDQGSLVFLGDSITQGWGDDMGGSFPGVKVANRGISGDTTRGMLLRLEEDVLSLNPSGVVLLMGTNDLEENAEPSVIADNLKLIIAKLEQHSAQMPIVLCRIFPSSAKKNRSVGKIQETNRLFANVVKGDAQVMVLDTWTLFANDDGDAQLAEFPDLLHPNRAGYSKWASALRPILATLGFVERDVAPTTWAAGYESLFNGLDLAGWGFRPSSEADKKASANWRKSDPNAPPWPILTESVDFTGKRASTSGRYVAKHGRLIVTSPPEGRKIQQIWTTREFRTDFVLKFDFRATPNADSEIFLRGRQLQCRDYRLAGPYKDLDGYRPQEWNEIVAVVTGNSAFCTCNGEVLEEAFEVPSTGPIGLEGDRGQVEYRNIRIKELKKQLPRSTPEAQGISSRAILDFVEAADKIDAVQSFMLLRHGHVVAEGWWSPYAPEDPHQLYSLSKSFASTGVGMAIAEGKLSLDDTVVSFFPEQLPEEPTSNLKQMRIRDLLSMSTGHVSSDLDEFSFESEGVLTKEFLALPVQLTPGTHFLYNTPATYMCFAIVQKVTGQRVVDYLQPRLFDPLGIERPLWTECAQGISHGGYGLNVRTEDIARFGQIYLQNGEWNGRQLIPAEWVAAATSRQTSNGISPTNDWNQGYGYQFWRCRHDVYRGDGAFGQFCIVMPQYGAVLAVTGDMGAVMQIAWDHLLPALSSAPLARNDGDHKSLLARLESLRLPPVEGKLPSPTAARIDGASFVFLENERGIKSVTLSLADDQTILSLQDRQGQHHFVCAHGTWSKGRMPSIGSLSGRLPRDEDVGVAGSGAWSSNDTFEVKLWLFETPYRLDLKLQFNDNEVVLDGEYNVAFDAKKLATFVGKRSAIANER